MKTYTCINVSISDMPQLEDDYICYHILNINDKFSMRVLTDASINSFNWSILNNETEGFSPEKVSKIAVNFTYNIFNEIKKINY